MTSIYVDNLPLTTTRDELRDLFAQYGKVSRVILVTDRDTGQSKGFAFIEMESGGEEAIATLDQCVLDGRTLTINEARHREDNYLFRRPSRAMPESDA